MFPPHGYYYAPTHDSRNTAAQGRPSRHLKTQHDENDVFDVVASTKLNDATQRMPFGELDMNMDEPRTSTVSKRRPVATTSKIGHEKCHRPPVGENDHRHLPNMNYSSLHAGYEYTRWQLQHPNFYRTHPVMPAAPAYPPLSHSSQSFANEFPGKHLPAPAYIRPHEQHRFVHGFAPHVARPPAPYPVPQQRHALAQDRPQERFVYGSAPHAAVHTGAQYPGGPIHAQKCPQEHFVASHAAVPPPQCPVKRRTTTAYDHPKEQRRFVHELASQRDLPPLRTHQRVSTTHEVAQCLPPTLEIKKEDVLCDKQRYRDHLDHEGNGNFADLIQEHAQEFATTTRGTKTDVARKVVIAIRQRGGRFLARYNGTEIWYEMPEEKAVEKARYELYNKTKKL